MSDTNEHLPQDLERAGDAVRRLPRPLPPADLADRTLARIEAGLSREDIADATAEHRAATAAVVSKRRSWWLRQITNPLARVAAMLVLVVMLGLVVNLDSAERIGRASERILGAQTTDRVERFLDRVFVAFGPAEVSDRDMANLAGLRDLPKNNAPSVPQRKPQEGRPTTDLMVASSIREA